MTQTLAICANNKNLRVSYVCMLFIILINEQPPLLVFGSDRPPEIIGCEGTSKTVMVLVIGMDVPQVFVAETLRIWSPVVFQLTEAVLVLKFKLQPLESDQLYVTPL